MKTVWIVDAAYLYNFGRNRPNGFDYLKLKNELVAANGGPIFESYYLNSSADPYSDAQNPFHTWVKSAAPKGPQMRVQLYKLRELSVKSPTDGHQFSRHVQKGVDVGIVTLMLKLAHRNAYDRLILSTGDGDFEDAVEYVKSELGKEVWINGAQSSLSADLQSYADRVLWLDDMVPAIDR